MGIFTKKSCVIEGLKKEVERLNSEVEQRDNELITVGRRQNDEVFRLRTQVDENRLRHNLAIGEKNAYIEQYEAELDGREQMRIIKGEKELETTKANARKELKAEFGREIEGLKTEVKNLTKTSGEIHGKYEGVLLANKGLNDQIVNLNAIIKSLTTKLPDVNANIKSAGDTQVTVNK